MTRRHLDVEEIRARIREARATDKEPKPDEPDELETYEQIVARWEGRGPQGFKTIADRMFRH